jgi:hypothetical protein
MSSVWQPPKPDRCGLGMDALLANECRLDWGGGRIVPYPIAIGERRGTLAL